MVRQWERKLVIRMCHLNLWDIQMEMRIVWVRAKYFKRLLQWLKDRQIVDNYHHAPACPANHYHKARLVFTGCTCGAERIAKETQSV